MHNFDVVIIGGGTAGLMLARELGKLKRKTLVLDRKDNLLAFSFNTLGSFINIKDFNLTKDVISKEIDTLIFKSKNVKRAIKTDNLYVLDKKKVHEELINAMNTDDVTLKTNIHIKDILKDASGNFTGVIDKDNNEYYAKIIVDASGTNAIISKKIGLRAKKVPLATGVEYNVAYLGNPNTMYLLSGKEYQGGYGWIFPLKNKRAIIGFGSYNNEVIKDLKRRLNDVLEFPFIKKLVKKDNENVEGGSIPITPVLEKFVVNNLVCVGDSVSQVNPIVGEGYKFIFEAALMASKAIDKSLEKEDINCLVAYETEWKNRFSANYKRSKSAQEKLYKYTNNNFVMDTALLLMRLRSDERIVRSLSGEYGLENKHVSS
ncbi:NAD(P)/FAD-dependent oxidoreductase [uncultured Polaribacter sp.]|uniref:lycopene cyclase family protein n=1 Tax=uncultured Polaribacter sp. TaxID=174711 RepID=UPI00261F684B|nr:NAD(P)/FAD-dependent oxidoreductase [uncultured Polaribacter sp.]